MKGQTPGTWEVMPPGYAAIDDLANMEDRNYKVYADSFGMTVHHVCHGLSEANAYTVSAVPEMIAALEAVEDIWSEAADQDDACWLFTTWWNKKGKPALDKAKGRDHVDQG